MDFYVNRTAGQGCYGFDFKDDRGRKTRYDADRNGRIVVDNPDHAKVIQQASKNDGGYIQKAMVGAPKGVPSKHCPPCRFLAYAWQTACPKCGGELIEGES